MYMKSFSVSKTFCWTLLYCFKFETLSSNIHNGFSATCVIIYRLANVYITCHSRIRTCPWYIGTLFWQQTYGNAYHLNGQTIMLPYLTQFKQKMWVSGSLHAIERIDFLHQLKAVYWCVQIYSIMLLTLYVAWHLFSMDYFDKAK